MPPKSSRISNLLKNFDFTVDDNDESFENNPGENALNDLLSRSRKKENRQQASTTSSHKSSSDPYIDQSSRTNSDRPLIAPRSTSHRQIPSSPSTDDRQSSSTGQKFRNLLLSPSSKKKDGFKQPQVRSAEDRDPSNKWTSASQEYNRRPSTFEREEDDNVKIKNWGADDSYRKTDDKSGVSRKITSSSVTKFDYSDFCSNLKRMSFSPLFAPPTGTVPRFYPEKDMSTYNLMLEDCLQDAKVFHILPWNYYEEKKDSVIKVRSQVQKLQNSLVSSPTAEGMTVMIQTLYSYRSLELIILRNLAAVLAFQVIASDSNFKTIDSELSSTKFLLKDRENLISKLEARSREKDTLILELEEKVKTKKQESDSDTDVEDEALSKKKGNSGFSISDNEVLELASILRSLDPSLPYPTPSNLLSSLSKLKSTTSQYSNVEKDNYKDKYLNLEKKYNSSKEKLERYKQDVNTWKQRYEESRSREPVDDKMEEISAKHANELRELKATLRREAEEELNAVSEQTDREIKEMQESFNSRLREAETGYRKQTEDLKKKLDAQEREIRTLKLENSESLRKSQSIANSQMDKIQKEVEAEYQDKIDDLERRLENAGLDASRTLERELEKLREAHQIELSSLSRRHKKELDKAVQDGILSKIDTQNLLDEAQATIEIIKQEAFKDKEETDREIQSLSRQINELTDQNHDLSSRVNQAESKYLRQIEQLESRLSSLEKENSNLREMVEVEKGNAETLKQDIKDKEVYIRELGNSVLEYQKLTKEFEVVENRYKTELQKKDAHISNLEGTIQKEKEMANQGLIAQAEAKEEAIDQLDRIKRRLQATEQDLARAKSFSEEKESEILDLKRLIRSQNKQLESALGGPASTPKLSKDDMESKIEILNTQVSSLKRQLEYKEKESFEVRMEAAEAFQKASDLDKAKEEINRLNNEIDKISLTMIELKSAKVQLLERVDNAEHRETLLKNELSLLKSELDRKR